MKTVLHGTCLLNGKHAPGDPYAKECPLRNAKARSARSKKAAQTRSKALRRPVAGPGVPDPHPDARRA